MAAQLDSVSLCFLYLSYLVWTEPEPFNGGPLFLVELGSTTGNSCPLPRGLRFLTYSSGRPDIAANGPLTSPVYSRSDSRPVSLWLPEPIQCLLEFVDPVPCLVLITSKF